MFELLKDKQTGVFFGSVMILISFIQLIGLIFEPDKYGWDDQFLLKFMTNLCGYSRIMEAIDLSKSVFFYWAFMLFAIIYLVVMISLLVFMNYFLQQKKDHTEQTVKVLRFMIILLQWVFYLPFFEVFLSIMRCDKGLHYMDSSLTCFQGVHIFLFVVCVLFLIILFSVSLLFAMLFNETQPVQEDCLSRMESSFEVALVVFRSLVAAFAGFCNGESCSWVLIAVYIVLSGFLCYQYYKQLPYYNTFISILSGSTVFAFFWISLNALLMKFLGVSGHIVIIIVGIPLLWYLVKSLREYRIEMLIKTGVDKLGTDVDALLQVNKMTEFSKGAHELLTHEKMTMIGIINIHIAECQNTECPCKDSYEMFDLKRNEFKDRDYHQMHTDEVFLSHFIKKLYDDTLNKFISSPNIHIAYSFYLFKVMNNIHSSLLELNIALKKKPSLQQQFTIFRYKQIIEDFIKAEHLEHKEVYPQLTNVIEFERLYQEMSKSIETVSNLQVEFWTHLTTLVPDLNVLNELGKKIYLAAEEVDRLWYSLCEINASYQHALTFYGEYLKEIRNHEHIGLQLIDRSFNMVIAKKAVEEVGQKDADALFSDDTTVVHVSGNKETLGKIMNASKSLTKVFGYNKNEVVGHSVNIMMPAIFAKRHTEFMERFFKTGRQIIFYQERQLFASHRSGNCFNIRILVKQFPNLGEGIQYVGLIKPIISDFEYIITDLDGVIDSFSKGIINLLGITPNLFKDKDSQINIMLLAPDLISFFQETYQRNGKVAKSKYREAGGEPLTLIVPLDFNLIAKAEVKSGGASRTTGGRSKGHRSQHNSSKNRSPIFKQFLRALQKSTKRSNASQSSKINRDKMPTAQQLLLQPEYVKCERRRDVQCEIQFLEFKGHCVDETRMLIFKLGKNVVVERENKVMLGIEGEIALNKKKAATRLRNKQPGDGQRGGTQTRNKAPSGNDKSELQSVDNDDLNDGEAQVLINNEVNGGLGRMNTSDSQRRRQVNFHKDKEDKLEIPQASPGLMRKQTASMPGSGPMKVPYSNQQHFQQKVSKHQPGLNTVDAPSNTADSRKPMGASQSNGSQKNKSRSLQEFNADDEEQKIEENQMQIEPQPNTKQDMMGSPNFKQNSVKSVKNGGASKLPIQEVNEAIDEEDIETPRLEVAKMKLEIPIASQQQREKISFLEDLKKKSFLMSENSTNKLDEKDKLNITENQRQEKISFQKDISRIAGGNTDSDQNIAQQNSLSRKEPSPSSMAKVGRQQSRNNLINIGRFNGDDEEPQDLIGAGGNTGDPAAADSEDDDKKPLLLPQAVYQRNQQESQKGSQEGDSQQEEEEGEEEEEEMEEEEEQEDESSNQGGTTSRQSVQNKGSAGRAQGPEGSNLASSTGRILGSKSSEKKSQGLRIPQAQDLEASPVSDRQDLQGGSSINQKWKNAGIAAMQQPNNTKEDSMTDEEQHEDEDKLNEGSETWSCRQHRQKDTHKIKTNPKYLCIDQVGGSGDENEEVDEVKNDDFWQLSSKEIDFREAVIKQEKKRLKKEKKLKDKELKKIKSGSNGEDGSSDTAGTKGGSEDDDEDGESSSESSESLSDDDKGGKGGQALPGQKKLTRKSSIREDDGDVSSVSTRQSKTERNHFILRMAIDEKFVPRSIHNLRYAAYLIFVILGLLSIVYYVIQISLFDKINQNIQNIHNSEERLSYIIDITLRTRTLTLTNQNLIEFSPNNTTGAIEKANLINVTLKELRTSAKNLKEAQTDLSLKTAFLSPEQLEKINPVNVKLTYKKFPQMPEHYTLSMWEAIMEIIVSAFRISTLDLKVIRDDQASVLFVMKNCLNTVLEALKSSTDAIITESETSRQSNMGVFLYLLIAASCSLFISLVFLIPVINKVKKNKQEVLELFAHKNIDRYIDDQLKVCRNFISTRIQQSNEAAGGGGADHNEIDEGNQNGQVGNGLNQADKDLQNELNGANSKFLRRNKKKGKGKKWKKLSNDFGSILLKFLLFIAVIEGYFLANFMLSKQFLEQVQQLTQELKLLISRQPVQSFLLLIQKELIYSNGTAQIEGNKSESYVPLYHESVYDDEESLLDKFSSNYDFHSTEYNDLFSNVIYSNVCQYVTYDSQQVCEEYNQGILKKGVYSSVIKYWDFLRQINHDFMESPRNNETIKQFLNDPRIQIAERMQDYYFRRALQKLVEKLEVDINQFFDTEYVQNRTIFIIYIFYILLLYFFIWRSFVGQLQNELWKTKSMLGILPIKVCSDIDEIRTFIISNSSNDFLSK